MDRKLLAIYLNDHLAGSVVGANLAKRIARENEGNDYGTKVAALSREIEEDKRDLERIMEGAGISRDPLKRAAGWGAEKMGRLKLNGQLRGYSPLSRVLELEGLAVGVAG